MLFERGGEHICLEPEELKDGLFEALDALGPRKKVLAIPPDITRIHSGTGALTRYAWEYYGPVLNDVLPALGTHTPMTGDELTTMFGPMPRTLFHEHRWRTDIETLGTVPGEYIASITEGKILYDWPAQVNTLLSRGGHDLILSLGQVVPHEVIGMANHNKNIFVGTGGSEGIHKSHFIGAVHGMERIMGRIDTPVRAVLDYAETRFANHLPIVYVLTVVSPREDGSLATRGLFIGSGRECFEKAAALSLKVNFKMLDRPVSKAVVYLDPGEFRSTWLGNKAIYRTRMALADDAQLIILAPGVKEFGEDPDIDQLIRKYGYRGSENILHLTNQHEDLQGNLCASAHLIHGSSEGRFSITYAPGHLTRKEVESVGYRYGDLGELTGQYNPESLKDGYNHVGGEDVFFISNPALGLWAWKDRFLAV